MRVALRHHREAWPLGPSALISFNVRYTTGLAAREEYTIIFPECFVAQIFNQERSNSSRMGRFWEAKSRMSD